MAPPTSSPAVTTHTMVLARHLRGRIVRLLQPSQVAPNERLEATRSLYPPPQIGPVLLGQV